MEKLLQIDILEKCDEYVDNTTSHMSKREELHLREGFSDGYEQCLKDLGLSELKVITDDGTHNNLAKLVADIRNKMGSIYNYISLIGITVPDNKKGEIKQLMISMEDNVITSMGKVKGLLMEFEKFNLSEIYRHEE